MKRNLIKICLLTGLLAPCAPLYAAPGASPVVNQQQTVKGHVVDETGEPLIGVTVQIVGKQGGAVTDLDGNFTVNAQSGDQLKVSYIGYADQTVTVSGPTVTIQMKAEDTALDELVVVGFGVQKKESLTGAVTVVDSKAFENKGGLSSPLQALQGQVPGVMITRSSSAPGDESWNMSLRGASSMNSTEPLVVIDGVACNSVNEMNMLNPNDIESINFLKDGSAAIYGSRAAGGVVLITTKKGKDGKLRIEYNGSATLKTVGLMPELMDIGQWADGAKQAMLNDNNIREQWWAYASMAQKYRGRYIDLRNNATNPIPEFTGVYEYVFDDDVDWYGTLFGSTWSTNQSLSLSGGSNRHQYRISGNFLYDGSPLKYGRNNNRRFNLRFNNTYKFNKIFTLESSIAYSRREQVVPTMIDAALSTANMPQPGLPLETIDGKPYSWGTSWNSPLAKVEYGGDNKLSATQISISETLRAKLTDWLDASVNIGYNSGDARRKIISNSITYYNYTGETEVVTAPTQDQTYFRQTSTRTDFYSFSGYVNAHKTFAKKHNTSLMLGVQYELKDMEGFGVNYTDILEGLDVVNGNGTLTLYTKDNWMPNNNYRNAILSYFGRLNYDYMGKYLVEFNARYDGSSKFLPENRWDFFWGVSAGWRLSEEKWLKNVKWLSNLKLRASYAEMGSQSGIDNYDGYQFYNLNTNSGAYVGGGLLTYIATNGKFASTTRQWERIKNYNIALDFGFFDNHLTGTVEAFLKKNDNMLVAITYPAVLGDSAPTANSGKFKDWGFEGSINYNFNIGKVNAHVGGDITFARNELTDYGGTNVMSSGYTSTQQGYPLNSIFGLRYGGKIQNQEQLDAYVKKYYPNNGIGMPANLRVGDNMFCDENGDGRLDYNDYIYLGSDTPEISYSFNFGAEWKGIDVNVVFQGSGNRFVFRGNKDNFSVPFRRIYQNYTTSSIGNTWSVDNPNAYYAPYSMDDGINEYNYQASSLTAQDARYIRLKNVTVGYNFPKSLLQKIGFIEAARVYFTGEDLWESTKIKDGWDPEAKLNPAGVQRYPFTRNFTFGLNLTF